MKHYHFSFALVLIASSAALPAFADPAIQCQVLTRNFEAGRYGPWVGWEMQSKHEVAGAVEFDEFSLEKDASEFVARVYPQGRRITLEIAGPDGSRVMNNGGLSDNTDGGHRDMSVALVSPSRTIRALVCQPPSATEIVPASVLQLSVDPTRQIMD